MVSLYGMYDLIVLAVLLCKIRTDLGMGTFDLVVNRLAYIMQQTRTLCKSYIGAQLGPGPRDGLMTGLARRTGKSIRLVRTALEVAVVALGWALGGVFGIGTIAFALLIGPLTHALLPMFTVELDPPGHS